MTSAECIIVYQSKGSRGWTALYLRENSEGKLVEALSVSRLDLHLLTRGLDDLFPNVQRMIVADVADMEMGAGALRSHYSRPAGVVRTPLEE